MEGTPNDEVKIFRSTDIAKTKASEKTDYFVKIKDTPALRKQRANLRRAQREQARQAKRQVRQAKRQALKAERLAKSLPRRQYLSAWFKIYRGPIVIIVLSILSFIIILGIIIAITGRPIDNSASIIEINSNMPEDELLSAISKVFAEEGGDAGFAECERLAPTLDSAEAQANLYGHCSAELQTLGNANFYPRALDYAYKAEELVHTADTARWVGLCEITLNQDQAKSQEYYDLAYSRSQGSDQYQPSNQPTTEDSEINEGEPVQYLIDDTDYGVEEDPDNPDDYLDLDEDVLESTNATENVE